MNSATSLIRALQTAAELYATQDDVAWIEASRVLVWLEPRLRQKLAGVRPSERQEMGTAASLLQRNLPGLDQFLAQAQLSELEDALELTAATGPDAGEIVNNLYHYTQVLETCIPGLKAAAELPTDTEEEIRARDARLARLSEEFDALPLGPSVLASLCLSTLKAADACHASVAAIHEALKP